MDAKAVVKILDWSYDQAIQGIPGMGTAEELAISYLRTPGTAKENADKLIRYQILKCGSSGFLTNLGGLITLPIALPANMTSVLYMQLRMIAAIAYMGGYNMHNDRVKTLAFLCLCGNQVEDVLKQVGIHIGKKMTERVIQNISGSIIRQINQAVGCRLLTKFGTKGMINLSKSIPIAGGIIGGGMDAYATKIIGEKAKEMFILN